MSAEHVDSAHDFEEGETATIETSEGLRATITCDKYTEHHSNDPEDVTIAQTWHFTAESGDRYLLRRTEGLRSYEWEASYPRNFPLCEHPDDAQGNPETFGYITSIEW